MKHIILLAIIVLLLSTVELTAQPFYTWNFQFDIVSPLPGTLILETNTEIDQNTWIFQQSWEFNGSCTINHSITIDATNDYPIYQARVRAYSPINGYRETRRVYHSQLNYFYIYLGPPFQDPTPPNPTGIGD